MELKEQERGFKPKTIENIIKTKVNHWIKSLKIDGNEEETKKLQEMVKNAYIVTGGAITSLLQGKSPNDFDVYLSNVDVAEKLAQYYVDKIEKKDVNEKCKIKVCKTEDRVKIVVKSAGIVSEETDLEKYDYFEGLDPSKMTDYFDEYFSNKKEDKAPYHVLMLSSNAITLSDDIQIILRFVGDPTEIHKNYDFVHCTNYYTETQGLVLNKEALISIITKDLKYVGSKYPLCSMFRIKKFLQRGWTITAGEMLKISWDINNLNLDSHEVLADQLVGVDAAYFMEILSILKKEGYGSEKPIDRTYLFEVINRVFDGSEDF